MKNALCLLAASLGLLFPATGNAGGRDVQSLDGMWQIVFDRNNEGRALQWVLDEHFPRQEAKEIAVPSCWELVEKDYEGVAIYGTHFKVPSAWKAKTVWLQFDAVNYMAEVWLNGHPIGRHEGGYAPFEFRVDDLLRTDAENFLSVRVLGPIVAEKKVIDGLGRNDAPHWRGAIAGGIWQSVRLVATGVVMVDDTFILPRLNDNTATVRVALNNTQTEAREVDRGLSSGPALPPCSTPKKT